MTPQITHRVSSSERRRDSDSVGKANAFADCPADIKCALRSHSTIGSIERPQLLQRQALREIATILGAGRDLMVREPLIKIHEAIRQRWRWGKPR